MHKTFYLTACLSLCFGAACSKPQNSAAVPTPAEEVPKVQKVFEKAGGEIKAGAVDAINALQNNDSSRAFAELQALCANPQVTSEQRAAASQAMLAVTAQLRKEAAAGDPKAAQALEMHHARK